MNPSERPLISPSEPYGFDLGAREYEDWLIRNLTLRELTGRACTWGAYFDAEGRIPPWVPGRITRLLLRKHYRRIRYFDDLARERGGPPPGPSWKVRD